MKRKMLQTVLSALLFIALASSKASAGNILLTQFDFQFNGSTDVYLQMKNNLESFGHSVNIVDSRTGGSVATALGSGSYDSVALWDLANVGYLNAADLNALSSFYSTHSNGVLDSRSYGYYFQGDQASEVALLRNVFNAFDSRGGGVWVGTDHNPDWTHNGNPFLSSIGVNPVTGIYADAVNSFDPASILLTDVIATDLWAQGQSVGSVPLGIQPNGQDWRFHFGHSSPAAGAIPYISASFGNFVAPDEDVEHHEPTNTIPEPASMLLFGSSALGAFIARKRKMA